MAVARYNFAARDMRELSLREGDVVKIYSRIGGDQGWWKGETNGRVSAGLSLTVRSGNPGTGRSLWRCCPLWRRPISSLLNATPFFTSFFSLVSTSAQIPAKPYSSRVCCFFA